MPVHPVFADKLPLLEGITSFETALADPDLAPRVLAFMDAGNGPPPPDAETWADAAPGPHGPVPLRIYAPRGTTRRDGRRSSGCTAVASGWGASTTRRVTARPGSCPPGRVPWWSTSTTAWRSTASATRSRTTTSWQRSAGSGTTPPSWASTPRASRSVGTARVATSPPGQHSACGTTTAGRRPRCCSPTRPCTRCSRRCPGGSRPRSPACRSCCASCPPTSRTCTATTSVGRRTRPTATRCRGWPCWRGCLPRWWSTPSTTTCVPPARRSPPRSPWPGWTSGW